MEISNSKTLWTSAQKHTGETMGEGSQVFTTAQRRLSNRLAIAQRLLSAVSYVLKQPLPGDEIAISRDTFFAALCNWDKEQMITTQRTADPHEGVYEYVEVRVRCALLS